MLFNLFYEIFLLIFLILLIPKTIYSRMRHGKYNRNVFSRFGKKALHIKRGNGPLVWVHAVSVGETKAIIPLMKLIYESEPSTQFILSSITETGHDEAVKSIKVPCDYIFLPFDFSFIIRPIFKHLKPNLVLISETDLWPRFLNIAKQTGSFICLVNGKISEKSRSRLKRFHFFSKKLLTPIDLFCLQNKIYADRFKELGIPSDKIAITGNTKFDQTPRAMTECEINTLKARLSINNDDFVVILGSTHEGEETLILTELIPMLNKYPKFKIIVVPRHPERFDSVYESMVKLFPNIARYTQNQIDNVPLILVDSMGILVSLYQIADLAIVGGSFVPNIGGHNILEPAWFGKPVIFGPYMDNQTEMVEHVLQHKVGFQLEHTKLKVILEENYNNGEIRFAIADRCQVMTHELRGASRKTFEEIKKRGNKVFTKKSGF